MTTGFDDVLLTYPRDPEQQYAVDATYLTRSIEQEFQVHVPQALQSFWDLVGAGYFGRSREFWLNLESARELSLVLAEPGQSIERGVDPSAALAPSRAAGT